MSTEAAYQAAKTTDPELRKPFIHMNPAQAKRAGRRLPMRPDWDAVKLQVMEDVLRIKFSVAPFRTWLLNTGDEELVEGNTWGDTFWGVCGGVGENHLGKLLMKIRAELRDA
jgi:ribA/ribD-fused uncharacterized protein